MGRESKKKMKKGAEDSSTIPGVIVKLHRAENLPAADSNGLSDPYCTFRIGKFSKFKSSIIHKTLNPEWQEEFFLACPENTSVPLTVLIKDKDLIGSDDYLCEASVDISHLSSDGTTEEFDVNLLDKKGKKIGAKVFFSVSRSTRSLAEMSQKEKVKKWAVASGDRKVIVEAIKGMDLVSMDTNGYSDPYLVMKLGKIKHTSKCVTRTLNPQWRQRFEFSLPVGTSPILSVKCWDRDRLSRDDFMGDVSINLDELAPQLVSDKWYDLTLNGTPAGHLHLLITVLDEAQDLVLSKDQRSQVVGSLKCHIIEGKGLKSSDMNGKSDPYVEIQVGNARLRTKTIYKTLDPTWDQLVELPVKDIFSCVELSVWDEDRGGKSKPDFLGKIVVPLLEIKNNETQWFALKSADALRRGKGEIRVAFNFHYKIPSAYVSLVKRREPNYMEGNGPFSVRRLLNAVNRLNGINMIFLDGAIFAWEVLNWERNPLFSVAGMLGWALFCLLFRLWQVPLLLLVGILLARVFNYQTTHVEVDERGFIVTKYKPGMLDLTGISKLELEDDLEQDALIDDGSDAEADEEPEDEPEGNAPKSTQKPRKKSRSSLMAQIRILRKVGKMLQDALEFTASLQERFKNIGNWSVPLITELTCIGLILAFVVLLIVPWNVCFMLFGVWQFVKRFLRKFIWPRSKFHVPIIEAVEYLARVPSDMDLARRAKLPTSNLVAKKSAKIK